MLTEWRDQLVKRWGPEPHMHPHVQRFVNGTLLGERMRQVRPMGIWTGGYQNQNSSRHHGSQPLGMVNHTCDMWAGGILVKGGQLQGCLGSKNNNVAT